MYWGGRDSATPKERILSYNGYDKIKDMQTALLKTGAKRALLWTRYYDADNIQVCPCTNSEGLPQSPHSICYATGIVGGYRRWGYQEWIIYRTDSTHLIVYDYSTGTTFPIRGNTIISDWLIVADNATSDALIEVYMYGHTASVVKYSIDGNNWVDNLVILPPKFKIEISNIDSLFESLRIAIKISDENYIYLSESPPERMEELLRHGMDSSSFEIRCWTVLDKILRTGDVIKWTEGRFNGQLYTLVPMRVSQLPNSESTSDMLSQFVGMRRVKLGEQLAKLW